MILHVTFFACPHIVAVLKLKKLRDPPGISSSNVIAPIADHSHIVFVRETRGIIFENRHQILLCKVYRDKSDDTAFLFEHVVISYLQWSKHMSMSVWLPSFYKM